MRVAIVTEGLKGTGYGHLTRCLSLYQAFEETGIIPTYIANCDDGGKKYLNGINFLQMDWLNSLERIERIARDSDIVVIDSYLADFEVYDRMQKGAAKAVYVDDYIRLSYPPGIIVNGTICSESLPYDRDADHEFLLGIEYAPLRKEFWDPPIRMQEKKISDVLIIFGGQDTKDLTGRTLEFLLNKFGNFMYHVVVGSLHSYLNSGDSNRSVKLYHSLSGIEILKLMLRCDLAISAAGQTTYELARLGVPTVAIGVAENQKHNIRGWIKSGFLQREMWSEDTNLFDEISCELLVKTASGLRSWVMCDGQGARRIVKHLCS